MEAENPYRAPLTTGPTVAEKAAAAPEPRFIPRKTSWPISIGASAASVYGPYGVMTLYAQFYVSCDHCQKATRDLLVCAPGLLPLELSQRVLGISRQDDWIAFSISFVLTMLWVAGLALLLRRYKLIGAIVAALSLGVGSFLATALLAMIRM